MEEGAESDVVVSIPYLAYMYVVGFGIIGVLMYAGVNAWPFWLTVLIGGVVQLVFRIIKRTWKNSFSSTEISPPEGPEQTLTRTDIRNLLIAYPTMVAVCALWYGIGWGTAWILS